MLVQNRSNNRLLDAICNRAGLMGKTCVIRHHLECNELNDESTNVILVSVPPQCRLSAVSVPPECRLSAARVPPQCHMSAA